MTTYTNEVVSNIRKETKMSKANKPFTINWTDFQSGLSVSTGFNPPAYSIGATVSFNADPNYGKLEMNLATLTIGGGAAKPAPEGSSQGTKSTGSGYKEKPFPVPKTHSDTSIIRQNSLTNANTVMATYMSICSESGHPDTPEELAEKVIEIAYLFTDFSSGQREVKSAAKIRNNVASATNAAEGE